MDRITCPKPSGGRTCMPESGFNDTVIGAEGSICVLWSAYTRRTVTVILAGAWGVTKTLS